MWAEPTGFEQKARANELFAIFKIDSIDNSKPSSEFGFDPERMYVNQSTAEQLKKNLSFQTRRFMVADPRFAKAMGVSPKGKTGRRVVERGLRIRNQVVT